MFAPPGSRLPAQEAFTSSDHLAGRYSAIAGDGSLGPKGREAAMLFSAAELSLNDDDSSTALDKAAQALALFRDIRDQHAVADTLRLLISAHLEQDQAARALQLAADELGAFRQAGERRGEAAMLLSVAEVTYNNADAKRRDEALEAATKARELYAELRDAKMEGVALLTLMNALVTKGARQDVREVLSRSVEVGKEALGVFRQAADQHGEAKVLHSLAVAFSYLEDWPSALRSTKQALVLWRDLGVKRFEAMELRCLGEWQLVDGKASEALACARAALKLFQDIGNFRGWEAAALGTLVRAHLKLGEVSEARQVLKETTRDFQSRADEAGEVAALNLMVEVHLAEDEREEALTAAERCLDAVRALPRRSVADRRFEATVLHTMAQIHLVEHRHADAKVSIQAAAGIFKEVGDVEQQAVALQTLSSAHVGAGQQREAVKAALEARSIFRSSGHRSGHAYSCLACCHAYCARGEFNRAISMCKEALKVFVGEQRRKGQADALAMLAEVYLMKGNMDKCTTTAEESKDIFVELGQDGKVLEELLIVAKARFWAANASGVPDKKGASLSTDMENALKAAREALALARKLDLGQSLVAALFGVGQVHVITRRPDEAQNVIAEALPLSQRLGDHRAEANLEVLVAQMCIVSNQPPAAVDPAKRALTIFKEILNDEEGEATALQLIRFVEGGGVQVAGEESQGGALVPEYQGPQIEDLIATIQDVALSLMGVESLYSDTPLMDAGLDSLASVEFQNNLQKEFTAMQMPATMVFDYPSVKTMAEFIFEGLREAAGFGNIEG